MEASGWSASPTSGISSGWSRRPTLLRSHWQLASSWTVVVTLAGLLLIGGEVRQVASQPQPQAAFINGTYINCGGLAFSGVNATWSADKYGPAVGTTFRAPGNGSFTFSYDSGRDAEVYRTVRYFGSQAGPANTYSIPVPKVGYYFVRLYFAEILYRNASMRRFNVSIEGAFVLQNFQLPNRMQAVRKEFFVPVVDGYVDISFVRGPIGDPMINGIAVIPAPNGTYDVDATNAELVLGTQLRLACGSNDSSTDEAGRAWANDTGFYSPSSPYSITTSIKLLPTSLKIAALAKIYQAQRTTANEYEEETNPTAPGVPPPRPLVYSFRVDPNEEYHVKLGFVEFLLPWKGARLLNVSIDGRQAVGQLDVVAAKGHLQPHVVGLNVTTNLSGNMTVAIAIGAYTGYTRDAFVSTIEVFKRYRVDSWTQDFILGNEEKHRARTMSIWMGLGVGVGIGIGTAGVVLLVLFVALHIRRVRRDRELGLKTPWIWSRKQIKAQDRLINGQDDSATGADTAGSLGRAESTSLIASRVGLYGCQAYTLQALREATKDFSPEQVLGKGGFGLVFRASLADGQEVAVKRLSVGSSQGEREFLTEVELLSRVHHRHLVNLKGYCAEEQLMLVYEFMANGTLRDHLRDAEKAAQLQWALRLQIAVGAARGLEYLHRGANPPVIHRDIKTSNILLDTDLEAKVADFGLCKMGQQQNSDTLHMAHISTHVKGTLGYLDPTYYTKQQLTEKSDVYSFGVVLLELLTGRLPIWREVDTDEDGDTRLMNLVEWVLPFLEQGNVPAIAASELDLNGALASMERFVELARSCTEISDKKRPTMSEVVRELEEARLILQEDETRLATSASTSSDNLESSFVEEAEELARLEKLSKANGKGSSKENEAPSIMPPLVESKLNENDNGTNSGGGDGEQSLADWDQGNAHSSDVAASPAGCDANGPTVIADTRSSRSPRVKFALELEPS